MDNIKKALKMAGGILLFILVVSFVIFGWGRISKLEQQREELRQERQEEMILPKNKNDKNK